MGRRAEALAYLSRVSNLLAQYRFEGVEILAHDGAAVGMFARAGSLLIAGAVLVEKHHAEEALALGRGLFTESLRLMTLDEEGAGRAAYALRWSMDSLQSQVGLVQEGVEVGAWTRPKANEYLEAIKRQQLDIQAYQRRHGIPRLLPFGDESTMARRFGREMEIQAFLIAHHMVHGSDVAHRSRRVFDPTSKTYTFAMESSDQRFEAAVAAFLGRSALYSCRAASRIFGWPPPEDFDSLIRQAANLEALNANETNR